MADGKVIIDSKLNAAGVLKGSKEIEEALQNTADTTKKAAKNIENGFKNVDYKNAFKKLPDAFQQAYAQIEMIRADDTMSAKQQASKIAAVFEELGDDQVSAQKKAWAIIEAESAEGSHKIIDDLQDISKKAKKTADSMSDQFRAVFGAGLLSDLVSNALDGIGDFAVDSAKQAVEAAAEIAASNAQFEQTFKSLETTARNALKSISDETGITATRMQNSFTKIFAFTKSVGADTEKALSISERALRAAADSAAYYDVSIEEATETLMSFIKGNYENDAALGIAATETTRNAKANEIYAQSFQNLSESQKVDVLLAMVEAGNQASGALGQAAREADAWTNVTGELKEAWRQFLAVFGEPVIDTLTPVIQGITSAIQEYLELRNRLHADENPAVEEFVEIEAAAEPVPEAINEIATAYAEAKEAARDSIDSQIGYFNEISLESDTSAAKIMENWHKQQEAFTSYTDNLKKAVDMGIDQSLIQQFADGSTQSMIYLNALVNDSGVSVDEINSQWAGLNQIRDTTAGVLAGIQGDFQGMTSAVETSAQGITNSFSDAANFTRESTFTPIAEDGVAAAESVGEGFETAADTVKTAWGDMGTWFESNVESPVKSSIENMGSAWSTMEADTTAAWNRMVKTVEDAINQMQGKINSLTGKTVNVTVNKTGNGASLTSYSGYDGEAYSPAAYTVTPQIPYLASGAVIPPNAPFLAMLGDQRNGTNIEAPMDTIKQGVREVLEEMGFDVEVNVNFVGELAQLVRILYPHIEVEKKRKGTSLAEGVVT